MQIKHYNYIAVVYIWLLFVYKVAATHIGVTFKADLAIFVFDLIIFLLYSNYL